MTPGGHVGASVVATYVITNYVFKIEATPIVLGISAVVGLLPDVDGLVTMLVKRERPMRQKVQHHRYVTHTPLFYAVVTLLLALVVPPNTVGLFGALMLTHLVLDSWATDDGIMWLWPLSNRQFGLFPRDLHAGGVFGVEFYLKMLRCGRMIVPEVALALTGLTLFHVVTLV
jgi:membrane-bound metal-dependent hydrolase YbcI (DUF457 family)